MSGDMRTQDFVCLIVNENFVAPLLCRKHRGGGRSSRHCSCSRAKTAFIETGSQWENGYASFNSRMRDELLNCERFYALKAAMITIEKWRSLGEPNKYLNSGR